MEAVSKGLWLQQQQARTTQAGGAGATQEEARGGVCRIAKERKEAGGVKKQQEGKACSCCLLHKVMPALHPCVGAQTRAAHQRPVGLRENALGQWGCGCGQADGRQRRFLRKARTHHACGAPGWHWRSKSSHISPHQPLTPTQPQPHEHNGGRTSAG